MKSELIEVGPTRKELVFEVPSEVVEREIDRVTRDYGKSARIPGFRPGRAPAGMVRQRFRERILHDVMHDLIPRTLDAALRERALEPVATPDIRDVSLKEGAPLTFTAAFETVPPIDPVDYATIVLRRGRASVTDEAVAHALDHLRDRHARFEPVEDRGAGAGDVLTCDVVRRVLGRPTAPGTGSREPETHNDLSVEVGHPVNPPGFDAEIMGMRPGDHRSFTLTFPETYEVDELAGAVVEYSVTLKAAKRKVLPLLDDEFAKDLGDFASLDDLRARVRRDLEREAVRSRERELRSDLLRQLAARVTFEVPEPLVEREVERRLQDFVGRLVDAGIDPTKARIDWQEYRAAQVQPATDTAKSVLILDAIARREGVEVTDAELEAELGHLAERSGRSLAAVRASFEKQDGLPRLAAGMRRDKTVELVLSRATISEA
jgi:trigger factor